MTAPDITDDVRPWDSAARRLAQVPGYQPGLSASREVGKLSSNEAAFGPSPRVVRALQQAVGGVHRYPDEAKFRARLAAEIGTGPEQLVLTNGSDELCDLLAATFLQPGDRAVSSVPAYGIDLKVSTRAGADVTTVPLRDGSHDLDALLSACHGARLLWLPNPHNPTGAAIPVDGIRRLLDAMDPACFVVLDEAYRGYLDPRHRPAVGPLLAQHPNLIIQRTFSKDHALAGLRLGYGIAAAPIAELLDRVRGPFSVNTLALTAAEAALEDSAWHDLTVAMVIAERDRLSDLLTDLMINFIPSQANFVTAEIAHDRIADQLADQGLAVRPGETLGLPGWVRISIGTPQAMADLRHLLRDRFGGPG